MAADTLTIILDGEVPLVEFARTIESFYELVKALSDEVGTPELDWVLDDLQISSAVATIRASRDQQAAEKVVNAYADVGHALEVDAPIRFSSPVRSAARKIVSIRDARVKAVRFETAFREATVRIGPPEKVTVEEPQSDIQETVTPSSQQPTVDQVIVDQVLVRPNLVIASPASLGGIQGRVQALSNRGGLRFTIYDLLYDKAVSCYMADGKEELLRNVWGRLAVVEGMITRDPLSGRPLSIRQVSNITQLPEPSPTGREYERARGILPALGGLSPEAAIRKVRDA